MIARFNRTVMAAGAAMAGLVIAGVAIAQQPQQQQQQGQQPGQQLQLQQRQPQGQIQQRVNRPVTQANQTDAQLAACLLIDNHNEVAIARLAQQRAKSEDVKKFATQMVEDHSKFIDKLQPFAGNFAQSIGSQGQTQRGVGQDQQQQNRTGGLDIVDLKRRIAQKCLESTRAELEKKEGAKFDHCYTGQQVMMHMVMLDTLEVLRDFASPELRPVLEEGIKTTEEHLKHAKDLAENMSEHRGSEQARRDEGETRK
jgi:predicted outer membrane protein